MPRFMKQNPLSIGSSCRLLTGLFVKKKKEVKTQVHTGEGMREEEHCFCNPRKALLVPICLSVLDGELSGLWFILSMMLITVWELTHTPQ